MPCLILRISREIAGLQYGEETFSFFALSLTGEKNVNAPEMWWRVLCKVSYYMTRLVQTLTRKCSRKPLLREQEGEKSNRIKFFTVRETQTCHSNWWVGVNLIHCNVQITRLSKSETTFVQKPVQIINCILYLVHIVPIGMTKIKHTHRKNIGTVATTLADVHASSRNQPKSLTEKKRAKCRVTLHTDDNAMAFINRKERKEWEHQT